jgi:hypothetical protein
MFRVAPSKRSVVAGALVILASLVGSARCEAGFLIPLGEAGNYAVYGIGVAMTPVVGGGGSLITGDVAVGNTGSLTVGGGSQINGNLVLGIGASFTPSGATPSGGFVTGTTTTNHDFTSAETALHAASTNYAAEMPDQTFTNITSPTTISATDSNHVTIIDVGSINLGGSSVLTLSGAANDFFIFNVSGTFTMGGSASITGVDASHVLFNVTNNAPNNYSVQLASGSHSIGTFLVPGSGVKVDGGSLADPVLLGAIIGDGSGGSSGINLNSRAFVTQQSFQGPVVPAPRSLTLLGIGAAVLLGCRWQRRPNSVTAAA